jgi:hypothetical protein
MPEWITLLESLEPTLKTDVKRIPARVNLSAERERHAFASYPPCRPSDLELLKKRLRRSWSVFKQTVRPRSRVRAMINRARTPY